MFNFFKKSDVEIRDDVVNELKYEPSLSPTQINVTSQDGVVTLRGSVPHYFEKTTAARTAQRVGGVRAVANEIDVDILGTYLRSDEDIARAALMALEWNYQVPDHIKVMVEKGWLTLTGEVEWEFQRVAAKEAVGLLMGVTGVINNISLSSKLQAVDIKELIDKALLRSAERDGRNISVRVDGSRVILSGDVNSLEEMEAARVAAWNAPGVMNVENNLKFSH